MAWTIDYTDTARRALRKIDKHSARQIVEYLTDRIGQADDRMILENLSKAR